MKQIIWKEDFKHFSGLETAVKWVNKNFPSSITEKTNFFHIDYSLIDTHSFDLYKFATCFKEEEQKKELFEKINNLTNEQAAELLFKALELIK